jgi:hypothetical protein
MNKEATTIVVFIFVLTYSLKIETLLHVRQLNYKNFLTGSSLLVSCDLDLMVST